MIVLLVMREALRKEIPKVNILDILRTEFFSTFVQIWSYVAYKNVHNY